MTTVENRSSVTYPKVFWLLIIFSIFGLLLEGVFCKLSYGHWESHVNCVWGPFCLIYGMGAAGCYLGGAKLRGKNILLQFCVYAIIGDIVEYFCSWLIDYVIGMEAWNYNNEFLNINGRICLRFTIIWGLFGVVFTNFVFPYYDKFYAKIDGRGLNIACGFLSAFMVVNMIVTVMSFVRWSNRHAGLPAKNSIEQMLDEHFDNDKMQKKFVEWKFIR